MTSHGLDLRPCLRAGVALVDLVGGEVLRVDIRGELREEWGVNFTELVKVDALEERVSFKLLRTILTQGGAEAVGHVAKEAVG